jgi:translation initiation factor IF-2
MTDKIRVSNLLKETKLKFGELKKIAKVLNIEIKSNLSTVSKKDEARIISEVKKLSVKKKTAGLITGKAKKKVQKKPQGVAQKVVAEKKVVKKEKEKAKVVKGKKKKVSEKKKVTRKKPSSVKARVKTRKATAVKKAKIEVKEEAKASDSVITKKVIDRVYEIKMQKKETVSKEKSQAGGEQKIEERKRARPVDFENKNVRNIKLDKQKRIKKRYKKKGSGEQDDKILTLKIRENISIKELSELIEYDVDEILNILREGGVYYSLNQKLNSELIYHILDELGIEEFDIISIDKELEKAEAVPPVELQLYTRAPIVTIMGHIDHGKTTLLDKIRKTNIVSTESGLITQHIGAYQADTPEGTITFIDTPGHSAFTAIRARGANITDIVVLVVAADDGIMPQTIESINHARAAGVPIIVAINKIDKEGVNIDRIKKQLVEQNLASYDWGGKTNVINISAKDGTNIDELLMSILVVASELNLSVPLNVQAKGVVLEAEIEKGKGLTATLIIQEGVLKLGDYFICGLSYGKVKSMFDYTGSKVESGMPSVPIRVSGFNQMPEPGDIILYQKSGLF